MQSLEDSDQTGIQQPKVKRCYNQRCRYNDLYECRMRSNYCNMRHIEKGGLLSGGFTRREDYSTKNVRF